MILIVAILSFVLSFGVLYFTRLYLARDKLHSGDTFFHLLISESIRKHQWKYPSSLQNVILDEGEGRYNYLAYPPLFHYITALFPVRFHLKVARILNLIILSLLSGLTAISAYNLTSNLTISMFVSFIVIFNLSAFELAVTFTPRPLGLLFYSLVAYISIFYPQSLFSIIAITVFVMLVLLTHKFATQMLVFGLLPYIFAFNKPYLFFGLVLGFMLSILVSRRFYLKILKEHISWLYFYYHFPPRARILDKLRRILSRNFWYLAIVASVIFLAFQKSESTSYVDSIAKVFFWAFIPIIIAFVMSVPALSFLGEEYRYIEYSVVPVGIASSFLIASSNIYVWLVYFVCIFMSFMVLFKFRTHLFHSKEIVSPDDILAYRSLSSYSLSNLLVFPHIRTLEVNYFTKLQVIHPVRTKEIKTRAEYLDNLLNKYEIRYILKFKDTDPYQLFATLSNMVNVKRILIFTNFELYELSPKEAT